MTMRAIVFDRYGAAKDVLRLETVAVPVPKADEVLVRVHAASVNAADLLMMHGRVLPVRLQLGLRRPRLTGLGQDFSGVVEAVGESVETLRAGDAVFAELPADHAGVSRAFADYVCVPESQLVRVPAGVSFADAAATPVAGCTALFAVRDYGEVGQGDRVLVNGAGGGVGSQAVVLAKQFGATVTAVCSARKAGTARAAGADHVIDYIERDFTAEDMLYDVIIDTVSSQPLSHYRRVLAPGGRYVWVGGAAEGAKGPITLLLKVGRMSLSDGQRSWRAVTRTSTPQDLATLADWLGEGRFRPVLCQRFSLERAAEAVQRLEQGLVCGKLVVEP